MKLWLRQIWMRHTHQSEKINNVAKSQYHVGSFGLCKPRGKLKQILLRFKGENDVGGNQ